MTERRRLENERPSITREFNISGTTGYISVGLYPDGRPGEVFLHVSQPGSFVAGLCDMLALHISHLLQLGVPLRHITGKLINARFEPNGPTGDPAIPMCASILDYIGQWLALRFPEIGPAPPISTTINVGPFAPAASTGVVPTHVPAFEHTEPVDASTALTGDPEP